MSLWSWLAKRYPGLKFVYEYSPKTAERREILRKIMNFVAKNDLGGGLIWNLVFIRVELS